MTVCSHGPGAVVAGAGANESPRRGRTIRPMSAVRRNNVREYGDPGAQPLVFAHGFGCDQNMWRHVGRAFEDRYRVVMFDHVGSGGSDNAAFSPDRYDLHGYARDVVEICGELGLREAVFVGHSVSSMIGALVAKQRPDLLAHLVMIGPSPRYIDDPSTGYHGGFTPPDIDGLLESLDSNYLGWSADMAPLIMGRPDRPELGQELTNSFCRSDPAIARHFARVTFLADNRNDLGDVQVPTLVMQCSDDIIAPPDVGRFVHEHLPNSVMVTMSARGHCPNLSAPDETVAVISDYLNHHSFASRRARGAPPGP